MRTPVNSFDYSLLKYIIIFIVLKFIKLFIIQLFQYSITNTTTNVAFSPSISTVFHPLPKILLLAGKANLLHVTYYNTKPNGIVKEYIKITVLLGPMYMILSCTSWLHLPLDMYTSYFPNLMLICVPGLSVSLENPKFSLMSITLSFSHSLPPFPKLNFRIKPIFTKI